MTELLKKEATINEHEIYMRAISCGFQSLDEENDMWFSEKAASKKLKDELLRRASEVLSWKGKKYL